jgi:hypothetical protein
MLPLIMALCPRTEEDERFEREQGRLATFLRGHTVFSGEISDEDMAVWREARVMLVARELLEACKYTFTLLSGLSTDDFAAGGDKPARDKLFSAITHAKGGCGFGDFRKCEEDVKEAIRVNHTRTP